MIPIGLNNLDQKYELYWSDHSTKRYHGVGYAIKVEKGIEIEEVSPIEPQDYSCYMDARVISTLLRTIFVIQKITFVSHDPPDEL